MLDCFEFENDTFFAEKTLRNSDNSIALEIDLSDLKIHSSYEDGTFFEDFGLGMEMCDSGSGYVLDYITWKKEPIIKILNEDGEEIKDFPKGNIETEIKEAISNFEGDIEFYIEDNIEAFA